MRASISKKSNPQTSQRPSFKNINYIKRELDIYQLSKAMEPSEQFENDLGQRHDPFRVQNPNRNQNLQQKQSQRQIKQSGNYFYKDLQFYMNKNASLGKSQTYKNSPYYETSHRDSKQSVYQNPNPNQSLGVITNAFNKRNTSWQEREDHPIRTTIG